MHSAVLERQISVFKKWIQLGCRINRVGKNCHISTLGNFVRKKSSTCKRLYDCLKVSLLGFKRPIKAVSCDGTWTRRHNKIALGLTARRVASCQRINFTFGRHPSPEHLTLDILFRSINIKSANFYWSEIKTRVTHTTNVISSDGTGKTTVTHEISTAKHTLLN